MKKFTLGLLISIAAVASYYFLFMAFYESWFPYYYEEYIPTIFLVGLLSIIALPVLTSLIKRSSIGSLGYFRSVIWVNSAIVAICALAFLYMLSNGVFLSSPGVYPVTK
ncbi:hypothetical protein BTA51_28655 [Hahella sp. CCB-MM4]|uniref:hypothetical protein n=1 Tax=Hahella sp. (strain CCB-MM4) TaxID=1926491 RepID=UPI000B9C2963|nr:hypothetical protein [Hahella sp. CCB-MM4]OZG69925.1 hypothetical protein BTA51_28655 [Hahella sp. CCB-MM4]